MTDKSKFTSYTFKISRTILNQDQLMAEKTVLRVKLCGSSVSLPLSSDELPGPSELQLTTPTYKKTHDIYYHAFCSAQ